MSGKPLTRLVNLPSSCKTNGCASRGARQAVRCACRAGCILEGEALLPCGVCKRLQRAGAPSARRACRAIPRWPQLRCVSGVCGSPHLHPAVVDVAAPVEGHVADVLCKTELRNALPHQLCSVLYAQRTVDLQQACGRRAHATAAQVDRSAERGQATTLLAPPPPLSFALISAVSVEAAASVLPTWSSITWTAGTPHPHGGSPRPLSCCTGSGATAPAHRCGCSSGRRLAAGALAGPPPAPTHARCRWVAAPGCLTARPTPGPERTLPRMLLCRFCVRSFREACFAYTKKPPAPGAAALSASAPPCKGRAGAGRQCGPAGRVRPPCRRQGPVQNCMPWPRLLTAAAAPWHSPPANGGIPPSSPRTAGGPAATLADDEGQVLRFFRPSGYAPVGTRAEA